MTRRILHVVGRMDRGGIETWLMHLLRRIDRRRFRMDFLTRGGEPGAYDEEIRGLGSRVIPCAGHLNPWRYARRFAEALASHGPYDVLHAHFSRYNGMVMRMAAQGGVPVRIAHCHTDLRHTESDQSWPVRAYLRLMRRRIQRYATLKVAVSRGAAEYLYGPGWAMQPNTRVIHCGVDLSAFAQPVDPLAVRQAVGLPANAVVIGHVGRFVAQKNHDLLLDVARAAMAIDRRVRLLLVGDGPLRPTIVARAQELGIADRVVFAGSRDDVPEMLAAMDVFVLASHHEGLGLALVEAQAAGLPCIVSDRVPEEAAVTPPLVRRLPLEAPVSAWVAAVLDASGPRPIAREAALARLRASDFDIETSLEAITSLYEDGRPSRGAG